jgi:hypothetical protein
MPTLSSHPALKIVRLLNVAESGAGKTGALASLVQAGYKLHILDYDNGLDIIVNVLRDSGHSALLENVEYETIRDPIIFRQGKPIVKSPPSAYKRAGKLLEEWKCEEWTDQDVLVLDTLNSFSTAAFNEALFAAGRLNQRPQIQDYGWMADSVLLFIDMITAESWPSHVVVNTHVKYLAPEDESILASRDKELEFSRILGLPDAKGQEISRNVAKFFNTVVLTSSSGSGSGSRRRIYTTPQGVVSVKASAPKSVKPFYTVEDGLAPLFADLLGKKTP